MSAPTINSSLSSLGIRMLRETAALGQLPDVPVKRLSGPGKAASARDVVTFQYAGASASSQRLRAVSEGVSLAQSGSATLTAMAGTVLRMRELAISAAGDSLSDEERAGLQAAFLPLREDLARLAERAEFGGRGLLDGGFSQSVPLADGRRDLSRVNPQRVDLRLADLRIEALGLSELGLASAEEARQGVRSLDLALGGIYEQRGAVRAFSESLEGWLNAPASGGRSAIREAGEAAEVLARGRALMADSPGDAMRAQGNVPPGAVVALLR